MISHIWYMISHIWYRFHIYDTWYHIYDIWYHIYDIWYHLYDIWYHIHDIYITYMICDITIWKNQLNWHFPQWTVQKILIAVLTSFLRSVSYMFWVICYATAMMNIHIWSFFKKLKIPWFQTSYDKSVDLFDELKLYVYGRILID